jgi:hypothetical protein
VSKMVLHRSKDTLYWIERIETHWHTLSDNAESANHTDKEHLDTLNLIENAVWQVRHNLLADLRLAGWSWARIGQLLGVSRQAAEQRYGRAVAQELRLRIRRGDRAIRA